MKFFKIFALAMIATIFLASCATTPDKVLPKKQGVWDVNSIRFETYVNGAVAGDSTANDQGTMTFKDDGTGTVSADGSVTNITWDYNETNETIRITDNSGSVDFDILESAAKEQTWKTEFEFEFFGVTTRTVQTWNLARQ